MIAGNLASAHAKFSYMNVKPKSFFATRPSSKIICNKPTTGSNLGPGKYLPLRYSPSPSFEFSKSPRFGHSDDISFVSLFKRMSDSEREEISRRIEKNKEFAVLPASIKQQQAKAKAFKKNVRASVTKTTKEHILKDRKAYQEGVLKEKFKKYEMRMNISVTVT